MIIPGGLNGYSFGKRIFPRYFPCAYGVSLGPSMRKYQSRMFVDEDGLASIPCSGDFKRSLSSFCKRSVAAMCSFFQKCSPACKRSEEEASCLSKELFSN